MTTFSNFSFRKRLNWILLQSLLISTVITTLSVSIIFSNTKAYANLNIREGDLKRYADSVTKIEKNRQRAYDRIKKIYHNRDIPNIVCNDPKSFGALPRRAQRIAEGYCRRSRAIVESHGLSIEQFNEITEAAKKDRKIKQQIYNELIRQQRAPRRR